MAFTVVNSNMGMPRLQRGVDIPLGTLGAANQAIQFAIPMTLEFSLKRLIIAVAGNLNASNYVLEASLDGGSTWFVVPAITSDLTVSGVADTGAAFVNRYDVSGLGGNQFRFGATTYTSGTGAVWAAVD